MQRSRKQSTTDYPMCFLMVDSSDHLSGKEGLSPTVTISKNGGSFASPSGAVTEIGGGWYKLAGNATDRATLGEFLLHAEASGADNADEKYSIVSYDPFADVKTIKETTDILDSMITEIEGDYAFTKLAMCNVYYYLDDSSVKLGALTNETYGLDALKTLLVLTGIKVATNSDKSGYTLHSDYNSAKTAAQDSTVMKAASYTAPPSAATIADAICEESLADHKTVANSLAKTLFETNQRFNGTKVVINTNDGTIKVYDTNGTDLLFTLTKTAVGNVYTMTRS